jgi:hypothetical protein
MNGRMYNPDFWEIQIDQSDLEKVSNESGMWFESGEDREARYHWEDRAGQILPRLDILMGRSLTQKQFEATILYFKYGKTQQEISEIMGISRRVVSQHLFGITRKGKSVGGAVNKLRKLCHRHGIAVQN